MLGSQHCSEQQEKGEPYFPLDLSYRYAKCARVCAPTANPQRLPGASEMRLGASETQNRVRSDEKRRPLTLPTAALVFSGATHLTQGPDCSRDFARSFPGAYQGLSDTGKFGQELAVSPEK